MLKILSVGLCVFLLAAAALADVVVLKDGRRIEGRLGGQDQDTLTIHVRRANSSSQMTFKRDEIAEVRESPLEEVVADPAPAQPTPAVVERPPALLALMNQYCAAHTSIARANARLTPPALLGRRVLVSGKVAEVRALQPRGEKTASLIGAELGPFVIILEPIKSTGPAQLNRQDLERIAEFEEDLQEARKNIDYLQKRGAEEMYDGLDREGWRLRWASRKKAIARVKREAFERKPAHRVAIRTPDRAALSLLPGRGIYIEATVSNCELQEQAAEVGKEGAPIRDPDFYVNCEVVADRLTALPDPPPAPTAEDSDEE